LQGQDGLRSAGRKRRDGCDHHVHVSAVSTAATTGSGASTRTSNPRQAEKESRGRSCRASPPLRSDGRRIARRCYRRIKPDSSAFVQVEETQVWSWFLAAGRNHIPGRDDPLRPSLPQPAWRGLYVRVQDGGAPFFSRASERSNL